MLNLSYHQEGDYLLPDLLPPESPCIGIWGLRRRNYLQKHHNGIYTGLLLSGKLNAHLEEVDRQAEEMLFQLVKQMAKDEGVEEALKRRDQLDWVQRMNSIRNRAEEGVLNEIIYQ